MEMAKDFQLYVMIDDVLKNDFPEVDDLGRRQEALDKYLLETSVGGRDTAKDYILMLLGTSVIDEVDGHLYLQFIDNIEAGRCPCSPVLQNIENRQSQLLLDTLKTDESHISMNWIHDFLTPQLATSNLAALALNGKGESDHARLLESISASARFHRLLTVIALRPINQAFAAVVKPPTGPEAVKALTGVIRRRLQATLQGVLGQLQVKGSSNALKASLLVGSLKSLKQRLNTADKAFGLSKLRETSLPRSLDMSVNDFSFMRSRPNSAIFEREQLRQSACSAMIFLCRLTVEQQALWRWILVAKERTAKLTDFETGDRKIRGIAKRSRKYAALTLWNSLLPQPSRFTSVLHSPVKTPYSELSCSRSSAYKVYLSRLTKLNLLSVLVMSVRCSVEQLALWKWRLAVTHQRRRLMIRILKHCAKAAVRQKAKSALHQWRLFTTKDLSRLPLTLTKSSLRWFFVKRTVFTVLSKLTDSHPRLRRCNTMWQSVVRLN
jgi:hypothetical protein